MSGTSLDGIDVAIVEVGRGTALPVGFHSSPYPEQVRSAILAVDSAEAVSRLNFQLGELYARAVLRAEQ